MSRDFFVRSKAYAATEARHKAEQVNRERTEYEARTANTIGLWPRPPARYDLRIDWHQEWSPLARWAVLSERREGTWEVAGMWLLDRMSLDSPETRSPTFSETMGRYIEPPSQSYRVELRAEPDDPAFLALCREVMIPALSMHEVVARMRDIAEMHAADLSISLDTHIKPARGEGFSLRMRWQFCGLQQISVGVDGVSMTLCAAGG